jgi:hypothetical protein
MPANNVIIPQSVREAAAREVLADHAERNGYPLAAKSIRTGDDPWFYTVCAQAMIAFADAGPTEPFGYWIEQKGTEPALLRKPAYIPEPSNLRTVTPLYAATPTPNTDSVPAGMVLMLEERISNYQAMRDECVEAGLDENAYALVVEAMERLRADLPSTGSSDSYTPAENGK